MKLPVLILSILLASTSSMACDTSAQMCGCGSRPVTITVYSLPHRVVVSVEQGPAGGPGRIPRDRPRPPCKCSRLACGCLGEVQCGGPWRTRQDAIWPFCPNSEDRAGSSSPTNTATCGASRPLSGELRGDLQSKSTPCKCQQCEPPVAEPKAECPGCPAGQKAREPVRRRDSRRRSLR